MRLELIDQARATQLFCLSSDDEIARYATMREDYLRRCLADPVRNRCTIALCVGAHAFGIPIPVLQAARDQMQPRLIEDRLKLMAFSRIISLGTLKPANSWKGIARAFHRQHPAVMNATHKYGAQIAAALEMSR